MITDMVEDVLLEDFTIFTEQKRTGFSEWSRARHADKVASKKRSRRGK